MTSLCLTTDYWLQWLVARSRRDALKARLATNARIKEQVELINEQLVTQFPDLTIKMKLVRRRLVSVSRGVPLTEVLDDELGDSPQLDAAQQVLLKKAFRYAAAQLHPDRLQGRSTADAELDFAALAAAYKAKDLQAVQEFALHLHAPPLTQLTHWQSERERSHISWERFRSSHFHIWAYHIARGTPPLDSMRYWLEMQIDQLELEILHQQALSIRRGIVDHF